MYHVTAIIPLGRRGGRFEADAHRIITCVNTCAGMADPKMEITQLRQDKMELLQVAEYTVNHFNATDNPMPDQIKAREIQLVKAVKAAIEATK